MLPRNPHPDLSKLANQRSAQNLLRQQQKAANAETARRVARYKAEDEAEERQRAAQREADRTARVKAAEAALKEQMRAKYLTLPGSTEAGFQAAWPTILREYQMRALADGQTPQEQLVAELSDYHRRGSGVVQPF